MTRAVEPAHTAAMTLRRLAGFFDFLRARGVAVGIGAQVDLGHALHHVDVFDRDAFRDACRTTLAKSPTDLAALDTAFDAYWTSSPAPAESIPQPSKGLDRQPADGRLASVSVPAMPAGPPRTIAVQFGVYSPEAPPGGHPLAPIDARRIAAMRSGVRNFRRLVATLPGRRFETARHGRIDVRRTSRNAVGVAGEWIELRRRRRRRSRAEVLVLWDVSGSMRDHDSDLAALVHVLGRVVRRSRVFAFSTEVRELTHLLAGTPYRHALPAIGRALGPVGGGTRIGRCLQDFRRDYGRLVHRRTTVLVVSDGWDLGPGTLVAREIRWLHRRAHLLAWVNPYARDSGFRPSTAAMGEAVPHIDLLLAPADFERAGPFPAGAVRGRGAARRSAAAVANG